MIDPASQRAYSRTDMPLNHGRITPQTIEIHIEELVLHGFAAGDRYAISEAIQQEIQRLLTEGDQSLVINRAVNIQRLDAGTFSLAPATAAPKIGSGIAGALVGALKNEINPPGGTR